MASISSQPDHTTQPPASNGISHESADLPDENNEHSSKDSAQEMDDVMDQMDKAQKGLLELLNDIATLKQSFASTWQTIDRLKQLVLNNPDPPHDTTR